MRASDAASVPATMRIYTWPMAVSIFDHHMEKNAANYAPMQVDLSNLIVVPALPEEVALHEQYLDAMEKERKAPSLWRKLLAA